MWGCSPLMRRYCCIIGVWGSRADNQLLKGGLRYFGVNLSWPVHAARRFKATIFYGVDGHHRGDSGHQSTLAGPCVSLMAACGALSAGAGTIPYRSAHSKGGDARYGRDEAVGWFGSMKVRSQLVLLALVALLPVAILAAILGAFLIEQQRETFRQGSHARVHALITAVDSELHGSIDVLRALGNVRSLDEEDLKF